MPFQKTLKTSSAADLSLTYPAAEEPADRQLVKDNRLALAIANVHGNDDSDDVVCNIHSVIQSSAALTSSQVSSIQIMNRLD